MEKLHVLGTGNAVVTKCFNTCFAIEKEEEYFLVDTGGGNGILVALEKANIDIKNIHNIFITHEHTDHLLGIVWLIRVIGTRMNQGKYEGNLNIYCHEGLVHTIKTIVSLTVQKKFYQYFDDRMIFHPLQDGDQKEVMGYDITFFDIGSTKAKQFGFTLNLTNGKCLTCLGDEPPKEVSLPYVEKSDWLLQEAFCLYGDREIFKPYEKHHSTVKEACEIAEQYHVENCIIWHTEDSDLANRKQRYTKEGKQFYQGNLFVPDDLEVLEL